MCMFPSKEDLVQFDFEANGADEYMYNFGQEFKGIDSHT